MSSIALVVAGVGDVIAGMFTWATATVGFMVATPLVLIFVLMAIAGVGIGVARSFIRGA